MSIKPDGNPRFVKQSFLMFVLLAAMLGGGCASGYVSGKKSALDLPMPAPGKAKVVFARFPQYNSENEARIHDGDALIGLLPNRSFVQYECAPGPHTFSARMGTVPAYPIKVLEADLLPDHIYYVKTSVIYMGITLGASFHSLYPGCDDNLWPGLPKSLPDLRETIVKPEEVAADLKDAPKERKRVDAYRAGGNHIEKVLPEHGQTAPITGK